jgi:hypothetical protein
MASFEYEIEHFSNGMRCSRVGLNRDVFIAYEQGYYLVILLEGNEMKETRHITNYHDISTIVSNWICNGYS